MREFCGIFLILILIQQGLHWRAAERQSEAQRPPAPYMVAHKNLKGYIFMTSRQELVIFSPDAESRMIVTPFKAESEAEEVQLREKLRPLRELMARGWKG